jgi:hypothetical protein
MVAWDRGTLWFPWAGDRVLGTVQLQLRACGIPADVEGAVLHVEGVAPHEFLPVFNALARAGPADGRTLAANVANKHAEKHHVWLSDALLAMDYASARLDVAGALAVLREYARPPAEPDGSRRDIPP